MTDILNGRIEMFPRHYVLLDMKKVDENEIVRNYR